MIISLLRNSIKAAFAVYLKGIRKPKLDTVYTSDVILEMQLLPNALTEPDSGDYALITIGEIYSPDKFYWFLNDNKKDIENISKAMT